MFGQVFMYDLLSFSRLYWKKDYGLTLCVTLPVMYECTDVLPVWSGAIVYEYFANETASNLINNVN